MDRNDFLELGIDTLMEDDEARELLLGGLRAYWSMHRSLALARDPVRYVGQRHDWEDWEGEIRKTVSDFGPRFLHACFQRLAERLAEDESLLSLESTGASAAAQAAARAEAPDESLGVEARAVPAADLLDVFESSADFDQTREPSGQGQGPSALDALAGAPDGRPRVITSDGDPDLASALGEGGEFGVGDDPDLADAFDVDGDLDVYGADEGEEEAAFEARVIDLARAMRPHAPQALASPRAQIDGDVLAQLSQNLKTRNWTEKKAPARSPRVDSRETMAELRFRGEQLMEVCVLAGEQRADVAGELLHEAVHKSLLEQCGWLPDTIQRAYLELIAALAHHHQLNGPDDPNKLNDVFAAMCRYIDGGHLGFVHGLSRSHDPRLGSWADDARARWTELRRLMANNGLREMDPGTARRSVEALLDRHESDAELQRGLVALLHRGFLADKSILRLLGGVVDALTDPALSGLRRKVREQLAEDEAESERQEQGGDIPDDWPFWSLINGRPAVVIGSEGKKFQMENIEAAFGFADLGWVDTSRGLRRVQALVKSIQPDDERIFIVMQRYTSHSASNMVFEHRDRALVIGVECGFGVTAVRNAFEKYGRAHLARAHASGQPHG